MAVIGWNRLGAWHFHQGGRSEKVDTKQGLGCHWEDTIDKLDSASLYTVNVTTYNVFLSRNLDHLRYLLYLEIKVGEQEQLAMLFRLC